MEEEMEKKAEEMIKRAGVTESSLLSCLRNLREKHEIRRKVDREIYHFKWKLGMIPK